MRLGEVLENGKRLWPDEYGGGGAFNHADHPTATIVTLTPRFFCVLPVGVGDVTPEVREALQTEIIQREAPVPPPPAQEFPAAEVKSARAPKLGGPVNLVADDKEGSGGASN